jgi:toxin-antitoxin system PIN domain toxin
VSSTVDANVLLHASDSSSPVGPRAREFLESIARSGELLYVFWPVAMSYLRIATHPAIFERPLTPDVALANLESLLGLPNVRSPGEADGFWAVYRSVTGAQAVRGNLVSDAHVAALMRQYDVDAIWTRDLDFRRFPGIRIRDPYPGA